MKDLIQCPVAHGEFQRWLDMGTAPLALWHGEKAAATLVRLEKKPSVDYLYRTTMERDNAISWNNGLTFCGVYDMKHRTLYLADDSLHSFMSGKFPFIAGAGPSMAETISSSINQRVEDIIANDRNNLSVQKITNSYTLHDLQNYQKYGSESDAIRCLFAGEDPDGQFHSDYKLDGLPETTFISYIQDPDGFIQTEAEQYIKTNQEKFLRQFIENDALLKAFQSLMEDTANPIHKMKAITDVVKASGAKTVTVTIQKDGQELTFKAAAGSLTGHRNYYSSFEIPAQDRRKFEEMFGRYADYTAEDITKITYGRNTIYEAAAPAEEQAVSMGMGGMSL